MILSRQTGLNRNIIQIFEFFQKSCFIFKKRHSKLFLDRIESNRIWKLPGSIKNYHFFPMLNIFLFAFILMERLLSAISPKIEYTDQVFSCSWTKSQYQHRGHQWQFSRCFPSWKIKYLRVFKSDQATNLEIYVLIL